MSELCEGGELFDRIISQESPMNEAACKKLIKKVCQAINHCHQNKIAHRDLKPENIMFSSPDSDEIKIIDFGLSKRYDGKSKGSDSIVGTPYYVAPEVLNGNYGIECDCWSIGVIMYIILSGFLPFSGNTPDIVFK